MVKPIDIHTYYIPPEITVGEKPMEFRCTVCDKPYYLDRKKHPAWMGCQCLEPAKPVPKDPNLRLWEC